MRVGRPGIGTGASEDAPHGRPKLGTMPTDMKKAATQAACPPILRASKPVSPMSSDKYIMHPDEMRCQGRTKESAQRSLHGGFPGQAAWPARFASAN